MTRPASSFAIILIAAGASRRFGDDDKLQADLAGKPVFLHALDAYAALPASRYIAVTRPNSKCADICAAAGVEIVENRRAENGMGSSIAAGMAALPDTVDFALIALADMPFVQTATVSDLMAKADSVSDIIVPTKDGRRGHPVLFGRAHFSALAALAGDTGGRHIIDAHAGSVTEIAVNDPGIHRDIDTPADLTAAAEENRA